jgi:hypothetical protein
VPHHRGRDFDVNGYDFLPEAAAQAAVFTRKKTAASASDYQVEDAHKSRCGLQKPPAGRAKIRVAL